MQFDISQTKVLQFSHFLSGAGGGSCPSHLETGWIGLNQIFQSD